MMSKEPAMKRVSIKPGALFNLPAFEAARCAKNLAVMNVATKVMQLTMGTAMVKSDFAMRKLLKIDAP